MTLIGLRVLFAITWLGGNIIMTILVGPALAGAAVASQADVGARLGQQAPRSSSAGLHSDRSSSGGTLYVVKKA